MNAYKKNTIGISSVCQNVDGVSVIAVVRENLLKYSFEGISAGFNHRFFRTDLCGS